MDPKKIAKLITEDPDILLEHSPCPECGGPAYIGLRTVECPTHGCRFYSQKQEEIINAEMPEEVLEPEHDLEQQTSELNRREQERLTQDLLTKECPRCEEDIEENWNICLHCGMRLKQ